MNPSKKAKKGSKKKRLTKADLVERIISKLHLDLRHSKDKTLKSLLEREVRRMSLAEVYSLSRRDRREIYNYLIKKAESRGAPRRRAPDAPSRRRAPAPPVTRNPVIRSSTSEARQPVEGNYQTYSYQATYDSRTGGKIHTIKDNNGERQEWEREFTQHEEVPDGFMGHYREMMEHQMQMMESMHRMFGMPLIEGHSRIEG